MRVLLDTNILYRWFYDTPLLSPSTVALIRQAEAVFVSSASLWEIFGILLPLYFYAAQLILFLPLPLFSIKLPQEESLL